MNPQTQYHELYQKNITMFPLVAYGYFGVQLFFFISGFVIFLSLKKYKNFMQFIWHRWLRLFPAMLLCSFLIWIGSGFFVERLYGDPSKFINFLPGLTFIEPSWWALILKSKQGAVEGAFWSLYTEVRFYFIFGLSYYIAGEKNALRLLFLIFCIGLWINLHHAFNLLEYFKLFKILVDKTDVTIGWLMSKGLFSSVADTVQYGMFLCGAIFSKYIKCPKRNTLLMAITLGLASAVLLGHGNPYLPSERFNVTGILMGVVVMCIIPHF